MDRNSLVDKIKATFLGVAIGDALGMPYEKLKHEEVIALTGGDVSRYVDPNDKHFLKGILRAGDTTDDTQLTLVVAESLIACSGFNIEDCIAKHVVAMKKSTFGWGKGTVSAINRLIDGVDPRLSGTIDGAGNGVSMKIAPFGILMALSYLHHGCLSKSEIFRRDIFDLGLMTHRSAMAQASGWVQARSVMNCFISDSKEGGFADRFLADAVGACADGESINRGIDGIKERLVDRFVEMLYDQIYFKDIPFLATHYGKAPFYVYDSLPLSYACFLKNPYSIESLYDAIRAGGDTDTNASMVGALLGALNGTAVFPRYLLDNLNDYKEVVRIAHLFCDRFLDSALL